VRNLNTLLINLDSTGDLDVIKDALETLRRSYLDNLASSPMDQVQVLQGKAQAMSHALNVLTPKKET
jgi:hypothetical protein